jgi:uncharacterized protein
MSAPTRDRLPTLDALRGFALLGVLVVNVYQSYASRLSPADAEAARLVALLAEGSFYPVFSLLFGLGFGLQLERGTPPELFRRRLRWLLAFGLLHGFLVWHGDILASYALVGLLLPVFAAWNDRRLLGTAGALYALTLLLFALLPTAETPDLSAVARSETYVAALPIRAGYFLASLLSGLLLFGGQLLALFALGLYLARRGVARLLDDARFLGGALLGCLGVALPLLALGAGRTLEYLVASPLLGFAYLAALALLLRRARLPALENVGRMALSNYLAQSLVCTLAFYHYGFGLYGQVGVAGGVAFALALFAAQLAFSWLWLRRFAFGPAEWVWRSLTYGRPQPWRW